MAARNNSQGPWDLPWKIRLLITASNLAMDYSRRSNGTINRRLMSFFDLKSPPSTKPINGVTSSDVTVDSSRNIWYRLYVPSSSAAAAPGGSKLPLIVYFHGGGFAFCAANSKPFHDFCNWLAAELHAVVVSVNYRLAPEHRYPTQYDDGFEALKFIDSAQSEAALPSFADLGGCFIAGDSAGGNIAHHVTVRASNHDFKRLKVVGLVALQPYFGGEERTESELRLTNAPVVNVERTDWLWKAFLPEGSDRNHEAANVFGGVHSEKLFSGMKFPATMVVIGGFDPLQDWQRKYSEGLNKCGKEVKLVEYPNAFHGFCGFPELPQTTLLIKELRDFIQNH